MSELGQRLLPIFFIRYLFSKYHIADICRCQIRLARSRSLPINQVTDFIDLGFRVHFL